MPTKTIQAQIQDDHIARLTRIRKPILAVAELIRNAVDADANRVDVSLEEGGVNGIAAIEVRDNGHGPTHAEAQEMFSRLGDSWKRDGEKSRTMNRFLHGRRGIGRFHAFGLGRMVCWDVTYRGSEGPRQYRLSATKDAPDHVKIGEEAQAPTDSRPGVVVRVREVEGNIQSLRSESAVQDLTRIFALYLRQYRDIRISFDGREINPTTAIDNEKSFPLRPIQYQKNTFEVSLDIVEWCIRSDRQLFLCDAAGFPLHSVSPGIQAPGRHFTAYIKSDYFDKLWSENRLETAESDQDFAEILDAARETMRNHFRSRSSEKSVNLLERWKRENIYPYQEPPGNEAEKNEQRVFDIVAVNINDALPAFEKFDTKTKQFQFRLLRHAIERAPDGLSKIITEVLDLPLNKKRELADLLDRTTLSHMIGASKIITDRLEFLRGIETLIFDSEFKHGVRERGQLHRILAENAWVFGEQYHLSVDDKSLTEVLKRHVTSVNPEIVIDESVTRPDGSRGIIDLMFSRNTQLSGSEDREHLIVELKRPDVLINKAAVDQIESYAFAIAEDPRFKTTPTKWVFWAVSSDIDPYANRKSSQHGRPKGMLHQGDDPPVTIWIKTWGQILNECKARLEFLSKKLDYTPDRDKSLTYLNTTYEKYLSDLFSTESDDSSTTE